MNYDEELVVPNDMKFADMPPDTAKQFEVHRGDILFNRTNSADLVGKVGIFDLEGTYLFASYLIRLRTDVSLMLPEYLNFFLNSGSGQKSLRAFATPGVSQSNISASNLRKVEVPVPSLDEQRKIVRDLSRVANAKRMSQEHLLAQHRMLTDLTNALVG